jgi:hypothetical protein
MVLSDRISPRKGSPRTYPLRRGYVFCETLLFAQRVADIAATLWHAACPADGLRYHGLVKGFIGGWPAAPVSNVCVAEMRSRCDKDGVLIKREPAKIYFFPGTMVRMLDGPYKGQILRVARDNGVKLQLYPLQGAGYGVYIDDRRKVEAVANPDAGANKVQQRSGLRGKGRLFRRARSAPDVA